jgi:hypothetical protein
VAHQPSTIKISRNGNSYEILNGVLFRGRSGALHELDISVVPHLLAEALRAAAVEGFPFGRPRIAIECKDVGATGTPDEMRSVVSRMYDITILRGHLNYLGLMATDGYIFDSPTPTFVQPSAPLTFRESNSQSLCVLARRGGISSGALAMTGLYKIQAHINVTQPSAHKLISRNFPIHMCLILPQRYGAVAQRQEAPMQSTELKPTGGESCRFVGRSPRCRHTCCAQVLTPSSAFC